MSKRRAITLLILFALFIPAAVMAQVLTGTVSSEGTPLVGVNVVVKGTLRGTVTDANGKYTLRLEAGTYQITFSLLGYAARTESVSLQANEERQLSVELRSQAVESEPVVVVGARASTRTVTDSPLPIDVLQFREISRTGQNSFDKILQYIVPSFNTVQTPVNDATALLDPWEIRNMGVSRTLILVNGKRKNLSSSVYIQTSPSRGEAGVDISAIPMDAIKRVEILRDGASAQYGSDALAGVINIVLKDDREGGYYTINSGITSEGDGERIGLSLNNGASIFGDKGFVNYTAEFSRVNEARRSGVVDAEAEADPNLGFGADINVVRNFLAYDKYAGNRSSSPATSAAKFLINSGVNVSDNTEFYANGAYVYKKVNSFANYRTPYWRTLSAFPYLADFFPNGPNGEYVGYLPTFDGDLVDYNATFGLRSEKNEWKFDVSYTLGFNSQDYTVLNSHNRGEIRDSSGVILYTPNATKESNETYLYRENSPINFKPGATIFSHKVGNIDVSRAVTKKLSLGVGTEFRSETFEIVPGDRASWDEPGADSFAGIRPENSGTFSRFNFGGYLDAAYDFTRSFLIAATIRNEYYSDFGNAFVYKISSRVKTPGDKLTLRGSYSTGFKAPQLHQIYTQRVQYSFVPGQSIQEITLVNNVSPQARILGVKPLDPEESKNLTFGVGAKLTPDFNLTLDYYDISISDRIVISNRVTTSAGPTNFFTNSIGSKTTGLDIVLDYRNLKVASGTLGLSVAGNVTFKNERDGVVQEVKGTPVIDAEQEALFFTSRPKQKFVVGATYGMRKLNVSLNNTYFGKTEFRQIGMDLNLKTEFEPKVVTDLGVTFDLFNNVSVTANVNNVFDVLPKWKFVALNDAGAAILADPAQVWAQTNLITFNGRYPITTYDGSHFSQLGRIFNLSLTHRF
jgi:iron complex outermembrane receptor protein